ncbi:MAG: S8 family serine peptidase [Eubacteriales bacterium]
MVIKRLFAFLLIILLLTPVVFIGIFCRANFSLPASGGEGDNPFYIYDKTRKELLGGAAATKKTRPNPSPEGDEKNYIVSFVKGAGMTEIYDAVKEYNFSLLAFSAQRKFLINLPDAEGFAGRFFNIIEYIIPDTVIYSLWEEDEEPLLAGGVSDYWEYEAIKANLVSTDGGDGVVVAILDSGVDKTHAFLESALILPGYNAITGETGEFNDSDGHGTRVAGIIVSSVSGVAKNAAILPVKITSGGKSILTSSLVGGIYFAADFGADVINMSFGGYDENKAEKDAVDYAAGKNVILVAAAGNEGRDMEYAGKPAFPASYENVISVASVGKDGSSSVFSQFNAFVDIAAPGENLTLIDHKSGATGIITENGTSYSAAFVSGAAALIRGNAKAGLPKRQMSVEYFRKLLEYSSEEEKNNFTGFGLLNLKALVINLAKPFVTGVSDGGVYFEEVAAVFENAAATLDGEDYFSGEKIFSQGSHVLTVVDEYGTVTLSFSVDTVKLSYEIKKYGDFATISFTRGRATVDGQPYLSGDEVYGFGQHIFTLTGPYGNTLTETFLIYADPPAVYGAEDGGVYENRVAVTVVGDGYSFLDGEPFFGRAYASSAGEHTVTCTDSTGAKLKTVGFTITKTVVVEEGISPGGKIVFGGDFGWTAFWDEGESGVMIFDSGDYSSVKRYIPTLSPVVGVYLVSKKLVAVSEKTVFVYDPGLLLSNKNPFVFEFVPAAGVKIKSAAAFDGAVVVLQSGGEVVSYDITQRTQSIIGRLDSGSSLAGGAGGVYAYSPITPDTAFGFSGGGWVSLSLSPAPDNQGVTSIRAAGDVLFIGGMAYSLAKPLLLYQKPGEGKVVYCDESVFIYGNCIYSTSTGTPIGSYPGDVINAAEDGGFIYLIYAGGRYEKVKAEKLYGAFPINKELTGAVLASRPYESSVPLVFDAEIKSAAFDGQTRLVAAIRENDNNLYFLSGSTGRVLHSVYLKYTPSAVVSVGESVAVLFEKANGFYLTGLDRYCEIPGKVSFACEAGGRIFALCGGRIFEYNTLSGSISYPFGESQCDGVAGYGGRLYISTIFDITGYDAATLKPFANLAAMYRGKMHAVENYVIAGNYIYDAVTLRYVSSVVGSVFDARGNMLLTETGLFSISDGGYIAGYMTNPDRAVILPDFSAILFGEMSLTIIASGNGDPTLPVEITGVKSGETYYGATRVWFDKGVGYMDGRQVESGYSETKAGPHTLTVVSPWGIRTTVSFTLKYDPVSMDITNGDISLGVGQTVKLKAALFPEGSEGEVVFSTESRVVSVTPAGVVTGLSEGEGLVCASVVNTDISACVRVFVSGGATVCTNPSYVIDSVSGVLYGVPPATDVGVFLSYFESEGSYFSVEDSAGKPVEDGIVGTGMRLIKQSFSGKVTDTLEISVTGDLDGDGEVTINDAELLYNYLVYKYEIKTFVFYASDLNSNAKVTASDLKALCAKINHSFGSDLESDASLYINVPVFGYTGGLFYITIQNDRLNGAGAVSGVLNYDSEKFSFIKTQSFAGELYAADKQGRIEYSALGVDKAEQGAKLFRFYFVIKNAAEAGETVFIFENTAFPGGAGEKTIIKARDNSERFMVKTNPSPTLEVSAANAELDFSEEIFVYEVFLPENDEFLVLDFDCPADCFVYFNNIPIYGNGARQLVLKYLNAKGELSDYIFTVTRGVKEKFPPRLAGLFVGETAFYPVFDPDVFEYRAEIEIETEEIGVKAPAITAIPNNEETIIDIYGPDSLYEGENIFIITCHSDGGEISYTLVFDVFKPDKPIEESSGLVPDESSETDETTEETPQSSKPEPESSAGGVMPGEKPRGAAAAAALILGFIAVSLLGYIIRKRTR